MSAENCMKQPEILPTQKGLKTVSKKKRMIELFQVACCEFTDPQHATKTYNSSICKRIS